MPNIKAIGLVVLDKYISKGFPYISLFETSDPWGRGSILTQGHNLNNLYLGPPVKATNQV